MEFFLQGIDYEIWETFLSLGPVYKKWTGVFFARQQQYTSFIQPCVFSQ